MIIWIPAGRTTFVKYETNPVLKLMSEFYAKHNVKMLKKTFNLKSFSEVKSFPSKEKITWSKP